MFTFKKKQHFFLNYVYYYGAQTLVNNKDPIVQGHKHSGRHLFPLKESSFSVILLFEVFCGWSTQCLPGFFCDLINQEHAMCMVLSKADVVNLS